MKTCLAGTIFFLQITLVAPGLSAQVTVPTAQYDNNRSGANLNEKILNTSNVNVNSFGKLGALTVDGRSYGQPLYIPNITVAGKTTDVLYVATQHNSVYAFDTHNLTAQPLWKVTLGPSVPVFSGQGAGCPAPSSGPELGIFSTPVIDAGTGTLYAVSTMPDGQGDGGYNFFINALDIHTGNHKYGSPRQLTASVPGNGYDNVNGMVTLSKNRYAQRPALLLSQGAVYAGFASCGPDLDPWHGWLIGYDAQDLTRQTVAYNPTADGQQGGIWLSGGGPVADSVGYIYFTTGNGNNGRNILSDGVVKMSPIGNTPNVFVPPNYAELQALDLDLSSASPLLIPGTKYMVAGGKEGVLYLVHTDHLSQVVQTIAATTGCGVPKSGGSCKRLHNFVYWPQSATTGLLYSWGDNDNLRAFQFSNGLFNTTPVAQDPNFYDGATAFMALSANGTTPGTGILWAMARPVFRAYDAATLKELWNSGQNASRDNIDSTYKWAMPTVADGKVYLPTFQSQIFVYGLLGNTGPSTLTFSSPNWTFANHRVGEKSGNGQLYVTNSGSSPVSFTGVSFTGANPGDFAVSSNSCSALAANATCAVIFTFTPTAVGLRSANLTFADNATASPQSILVQGAGTQ